MSGHSYLDEVIASLSRLNLEGDIVDREQHPVGFGSTCDVFPARSIKHNTKVAVKRIRFFLAKSEAFAKVRIRVLNSTVLQYVLT